MSMKTSLGALSVLVEGKILGSRHRHANDTNLHEKDSFVTQDRDFECPVSSSVINEGHCKTQSGPRQMTACEDGQFINGSTTLF
ncbi:hypothetical protein J6590_004801 [Homalodisca vitripennis]|nr:hypothetical protein J6590_004801 [Homalodisca vitripennis]